MNAVLGPEVICSSKGCNAAAEWVISWRNPRIHDAARRKRWVACADHLDHLQGFLAARSFPLEVGALADEPAAPATDAS